MPEFLLQVFQHSFSHFLGALDVWAEAFRDSKALRCLVYSLFVWASLSSWLQFCRAWHLVINLNVSRGTNNQTWLSLSEGSADSADIWCWSTVTSVMFPSPCLSLVFPPLRYSTCLWFFHFLRLTTNANFLEPNTNPNLTRDPKISCFQLGTGLPYLVAQAVPT